MYEITREIGLDAGHRIALHGSKCQNVHGHRYRVLATITGPLVEEGSESGMVVDFGFLKDYMMTTIHDYCDHRLILGRDDPLVNFLIEDEVAGIPEIGDRGTYCVTTLEAIVGFALYVIKETPTAENLAEHWFVRLDSLMRARGIDRAHLKSLTVFETPNCYAVYTPPQAFPPLDTRTAEDVV